MQLFTGDVLEPDTLGPPSKGCDAAYYLVHSIGTGGDFAATEATAARNVRDAADAAGLRRIVYLGGMGSGDALSKHLASRHRVGEILASGRTATTELRAAVIIGSGSISFEMLRYLTEVLPAMITPRWVRTKCQPIAISDVLHYLTAVLDDPETIDRVLEIGGTDVVTYAEMMQTYAEVAGLPRRVIVPVPLLSPRLSSRWVGLVTPLPARIAVPLIDSLRHEVVMTNHDIDTLVPHQPLGFRESLELALRHTRAEAIDTRWTDAGFASADAIPGDPDWAGGSIFEDHQTVESDATPDALYRAFARIGGEHGYYVVELGVVAARAGRQAHRRTRATTWPAPSGRPAARRVARLLARGRGGARPPVGARSRDEGARQGVADVAHRTRRSRTRHGARARCGCTKWRSSLPRVCSAASTGTRCCRSTGSSSGAWPTPSPTTRRTASRSRARSPSGPSSCWSISAVAQRRNRSTSQPQSVTSSWKTSSFSSA